MDFLKSTKIVSEDKRLSRSLTLFVWGPIQILIGFFLLYWATSLIFEFINFILGVRYFGHNNVTGGGIALIAIAYFYLMAMAKVKEAHVGQPTLLGARRKNFFLQEGYSLILPWPFMGYSEVPIQPTTTTLKEPMEILVSKQPKKDGDEDTKPPSQLVSDELYQVRMKILMSIMWEVDPANLFNYTSVEGGKKGVETALVDVMRRSIREKAQHMTDTEVLVGQETFENAVRAALKEGPKKEKPEDAPEEEKIEFAHKLGIKIIKVQTVKIVPSDEELTKKYERLRGEDLDKQAETKQALHIANDLIKTFVSEDVSPDMAFLGALAMTKDAKLVGVVGNAGDFTKGKLGADEGDR